MILIELTFVGPWQGDIAMDSSLPEGYVGYDALAKCVYFHPREYHLFSLSRLNVIDGFVNPKPRCNTTAIVRYTPL